MTTASALCCHNKKTNTEHLLNLLRGYTLKYQKGYILSPVFFNHNIMAFSVRPLIFRARFSMNKEKSYTVTC